MENNKMSADSWLNVIKQASDYNESMTPLIKKYGELLTTSLQKQIEERDEMLERMAELLKTSKRNIEIELVSYSLMKEIEELLEQYQNSKK